MSHGNNSARLIRNGFLNMGFAESSSLCKVAFSILDYWRYSHRYHVSLSCSCMMQTLHRIEMYG